jgi:tetratricopeptide (TPR) repeat protein
MRLPRPLAVAAALSIVVIATAWPPPPTSMPEPGAVLVSRPLPDDAETGPAATTAANIAFWQQRLRVSPVNFVAATMLGRAWAQRGRETGDVADLARADEALRQALAVNPRHLPAKAALAGVLFAEHRFVEALRLATAVTAADPGQTQAQAVAADARLELGDIDRAETEYRRLVARAPGAAAYARLARVEFLRGHTSQALDWAQRAVQASRTDAAGAETAAWYRVQLADVSFTVGRLDEAENGYRDALGEFPRYYLAVAGLARVAAARGDLAAAERLYRRAVHAVPRPDLLAALGDVLAARGDTAGAERQYVTVEYIAGLGRQVHQRQLALFRADHRRRTREALALAQAELTVRTDVYGWDAVAWTAYQAGQYPLAARAAQRAVALGTEDPRLLYHAGMAALGVGDRAQARVLLARALQLNPVFDPLQAPRARAALRQVSQ